MCDKQARIIFFQFFLRVCNLSDFVISGLKKQANKNQTKPKQAACCSGFNDGLLCGCGPQVISAVSGRFFSSFLEIYQSFLRQILICQRGKNKTIALLFFPFRIWGNHIQWQGQGGKHRKKTSVVREKKILTLDSPEKKKRKRIWPARRTICGAPAPPSAKGAKRNVRCYRFEILDERGGGITGKYLRYFSSRTRCFRLVLFPFSFPFLFPVSITPLLFTNERLESLFFSRQFQQFSAACFTFPKSRITIV